MLQRTNTLVWQADQDTETDGEVIPSCQPAYAGGTTKKGVSKIITKCLYDQITGVFIRINLHLYKVSMIKLNYVMSTFVWLIWVATKAQNLFNSFWSLFPENKPRPNSMVRISTSSLGTVSTTGWPDAKLKNAVISAFISLHPYWCHSGGHFVLGVFLSLLIWILSTHCSVVWTCRTLYICNVLFSLDSFRVSCWKFTSFGFHNSLLLNDF